MLTVMRAELTADPVLRPAINKETGRQHKVVDASIAYQNAEGGAKTYTHAVAWDQVAEALAGKKKGDVIEFAANLTYSEYKNANMEKGHQVLGFTILALDESKTICQKLEEFMGVQRRPQDKDGAIFQPMRGTLYGDPVVNTVNKDGRTFDACSVTLSYWNGKSGFPNAYVSVSAFGEEARALGQMKKGDAIQFVGRLDSKPYKNEKMENVHMELSYNMYSIDPERTLCRDTEKFIREEMGIEKRPLKDKLQDAEERKAGPAEVDKDTPSKEVAEPAK